MTDTDRKAREAVTGGESHEARQAGLAPESHNDEQDDHRSQAQEITEQALTRTSAEDSPTESTKHKSGIDLDDDSSQDVVDHMRDMESSGRIDMNAYRGEPNMDDNEDKYGDDNKLDKDLPSDGS